MPFTRGGEPGALSVGGVTGALSVGGVTGVAAKAEGPLPLLSIRTASGNLPTNTTDYLDATYSLTDPDGAATAGAVRIRGRGNYTWTLPKKPWRLNFGTATAPLGMTASQRNWALLANHDDPRKVANILGLTLGAQMSGLDWTPQFRQVELHLNGVYWGLYLLTDLVRMEAGRVSGPEVTGVTGDTLTGTWLAEINRRYVGDGEPGFTTTRDVKIQFDEPSVDLLSADPVKAAQAAYFRDWIQAFENRLFSVNFLDPQVGYAPLVDMTSFADWYLVNEFGSNQDSWFESSCKIWKERDSLGGRLHMGPLWDMGISFGNEVNVDHAPDAWNTINATAPGATWIKRMMSDPTFKALLLERWAVLKTHLPLLAATVDDAYARQSPAIDRDEDRWALTHINPASEAAYVKGWMVARAAWMDSVLPAVEGAGPS